MADGDIGQDVTSARQRQMMNGVTEWQCRAPELPAIESITPKLMTAAKSVSDRTAPPKL